MLKERDAQVVSFKLVEMDYKYFDEVIDKLIDLEKLGILRFSIAHLEKLEDLKDWARFPNDFKYYLEKLGHVTISFEERYLMISTLVEGISDDEFEFFEEWVCDKTLRSNPNLLFVIRDVNSTFYAYHLDENPIKIYEYYYSDKCYNNIFEIIEEQVIATGEEWKKYYLNKS